MVLSPDDGTSKRSIYAGAELSLVALLFFATTINYLDRIVLAVLIPVIRKDLGFSDREYGLITGAFQIAYTIGFLAAGKIIDVPRCR